jgi:sulfur carrier protein ThiS
LHDSQPFQRNLAESAKFSQNYAVSHTFEAKFCQVGNSALYWAKCHPIRPLIARLFPKPLEVQVRLYSILREKLPAEARGRATLQLEEGTTVAAIIEQFEIERRVVVGVNGAYERDHSRPVQHGDKVTIFSAVSGG